jgi:acyl carrier protein phosphodiesterase
MNYLAHAYLSFDHPEIVTGNLISDFVKGKNKFNYPVNIQKGINLHRLIDQFTDTHEATKEAKEIFRPHYRLYSGAIMDVLYDHFLATDKTEFFTENSLFSFSQQVYVDLDKQFQWLPPRFAAMFPHMKSHNWLFNYRSIEGTARSLEGLVRRALYLNESTTAFQLFEKHYQLFGECYRQFWAAAKPFARQQFEILLSDITSNNH